MSTHGFPVKGPDHVSGPKCGAPWFQTYFFNSSSGFQLSLVRAVNKPKTSGWLLFGYDVPEEPSRIRVRIWRQLKGLGALYPQMSFCILPDSTETRSRLDALASSLKGYGPRLILQAKATNRPHLHTLLTLFREDIEKEYSELAEECEEYLDEIHKNLSTGNVTQTEVSELEEALEGLERWFSKIKARDFIGSGGEMKVPTLIKRCRNALLSFSDKAQPVRSEVPVRKFRK
jgi:hypothetical protein